MIPAPITDDMVLPTTIRQTFAAPAGMEAMVQPVDALVYRADESNVPLVSVRLQLEPGDLEALAVGKSVWLTMIGGLTPFDVEIADHILLVDAAGDSAATRLDGDERRVWTDDGHSTEVLRQVGWRGQTGQLYQLGLNPAPTEPGGFAPVWECVESEPSADYPTLAGQHAAAVTTVVFGADG